MAKAVGPLRSLACLWGGVTAPLPDSDRCPHQAARTCRVCGCQERAFVRGFCRPCWSGYLVGRWIAEMALELRALGLRAEVEEGLVGAPELWDAMALNLAAWRS